MKNNFYTSVNITTLLAIRFVLIYRIGKISDADMAKFAILELIFFEIVQIYVPIFAHAPNNF